MWLRNYYKKNLVYQGFCGSGHHTSRNTDIPFFFCLVEWCVRAVGNENGLRQGIVKCECEGVKCH